jgi:hypothetical protein
MQHVWEERKDAYKALLWRPEGKRALMTPRLRYEHNIKIDLQEEGWVGMDWMDLAGNRDRWLTLINGVMNLWTP